MVSKSKQKSFSKKLEQLKEDESWYKDPEVIKLLIEGSDNFSCVDFIQEEINVKHEYAPVSIHDFEPIGWDSPY